MKSMYAKEYHSVYPPFLLCVWGGEGLVELSTKFSKRGGLGRTLTFRGGCWERGRVTFFRRFAIFTKKIKSEIFNDGKSYKVISKNIFLYHN